MKKQPHDTKSPPEAGSVQPARRWSIPAGVAVAIAAGAGWYLTNCLTDQRQAQQAAKEAWSAVRVTGQKYVDARRALYEHMDLFYLRIARESPSAEWIEGRRNELIAMLESVEGDCNAAKVTRYEFDRQLRYACNRLIVQVPEVSDPTIIEQMCGSHSRAAARLRLVDAGVIAKASDRSRIEESRASIAENVRLVDETREAERDHNRRVQAFFSQIEGRPIWSEVWACAKNTTGSH